MTTGLSDLAPGCDVILSDIWGVVHNGVAAHQAACAALARFRDDGGTVILVSNAPRPSLAIVPQLDAVGVPRTAWDGIVTSGDVARHLITARGMRQVMHIGPPRDLPLFEGLAVELVGPEDAEVLMVTGLDDDETEQPEDYRARLKPLATRDLPLICANPDRVVERGDKLVWCAGALADLYEELGGSVVATGKPAPMIYEAALNVAASVQRRAIDRSRVLAIGDAVRTDLMGAAASGIPVAFVTGGIHAGEIGNPPDAGKIEALLAPVPSRPVAVMPQLRW